LNKRVFEQSPRDLVGNANAIRQDMKLAAGDGVGRVGERQSGARPAQPIEGPI